MKIILFALVVATALTSCNGNANETTKVTEQLVMESNQKAVNKGDVVPSDLVCMVNDEYMGKKQFEVSFEGKTYYGCCQMCKERIPKDQSVQIGRAHV